MNDKNGLRALTADEVAARLARETPLWRHEGGMLVRVYRTKSWQASMLAAGAVGHLAEAAWHHPDLVVSFSRLEVRLQTHDAGGITDKDFALARKIEEVLSWRPGGEGEGYILHDG